MKILLGDFNKKIEREDIFKLVIHNESLHEVSNDNGARVVILQLWKPNCQEHNIPTPWHL
jgi:hypothetical protein